MPSHLLSPLSRWRAMHLYAARLLLVGLLAGLLAGLSLPAQAGEAARVVFVAGAVHTGNKQLVLGNAIEEGDQITTGTDGYVYLKTVDAGFLILRPSTQAKIVAYTIDKQYPENNRVKLELISGVARSISGEGVKQSRQNFRFNTPVAAIGVRGTDFTVFTDQNTSRVTVVSGGVIVTPFADGCRPEGRGPCEGATSRELFATQMGQLLQINKGQIVPQLLHGTAVAPEGAAPARTDEPSAKGTATTTNVSAKATSGTDTNTSLTAANVSLTMEQAAAVQKDILAVGTVTSQPAPMIVPVVPVAPPVASQIIWGRWQAVLNQGANVDLTKLLDGSRSLIAINPQFALLRDNSAAWQVPHDGAMGFALQTSEAYVLNEASGLLNAATVGNGKLNVNFANASFTTSLDLLNQTTLYKLQASGVVTPDGLLSGDRQYTGSTNILVNGALGAANSQSAAYLFQGRLDATHTTAGATTWTKN